MDKVQKIDFDMLCLIMFRKYPRMDQKDLNKIRKIIDSYRESSNFRLHDRGDDCDTDDDNDDELDKSDSCDTFNFLPFDPLDSNDEFDSSSSSSRLLLPAATACCSSVDVVEDGELDEGTDRG
ncbi:hypothetical protein BpHYR1_040838 [Brachionus plicatilis]|uniref:Uncharacterized protein n=1 Tax=Brachionus plicatilis TaxID=10195 RepID=A0A3M7PH15_BRAPC|nr:hypothetical protein BpHYR1_040838 [Brachionus plicatilis]